MENQIRVIAIDPGKTTGYCLGKISEGAIHFEVSEAKLAHIDVWNLLEDFSPDWIICESFEMRKNQAGADLFPREVIGIIQLYAEKFDMVSLHKQTAGQGKGHFSNAHLKEYGVYAVGKQHGRDATRHLMHWLTFGAGYQFEVTEYHMVVS